jgi:hypothetical protein
VDISINDNSNQLDEVQISKGGRVTETVVSGLVSMRLRLLKYPFNSRRGYFKSGYHFSSIKTTGRVFRV